MENFITWLRSTNRTDPDIIELRKYLEGKDIKAAQNAEIYEEIRTIFKNDPDEEAKLRVLDRVDSIYNDEQGSAQPPATPPSPLEPTPPSRLQQIFRFLSDYAAGFTVLLVALFSLVIITWGMFFGDFFIGLASVDRARGLITFLFAIGTIIIFLLTAIVLFVSNAPLALEGRFDRAKDLLTMLIGIFGTIVGFYFGSATGEGVIEDGLEVRPAVVSDNSPSAGSNITISSVVRGGDDPYIYSVVFNANTGDIDVSELNATGVRSEDGLIAYTFTVPAVEEDTALSFMISVTDEAGNSTTLQGPEISIQAGG